MGIEKHNVRAPTSRPRATLKELMDRELRRVVKLSAEAQAVRRLARAAAVLHVQEDAERRDAPRRAQPTVKACSWCGAPIERGRFCSKLHRQTAWRLRGRSQLTTPPVASSVHARPEPGRFCYADPPYPGTARKYYGQEPTFAGEVDHAALIASLSAESYMGWALSTSGRALRDLLPLCPPDVRVGVWVKPIGVSSRARGPFSRWEALIVAGGRRVQPAVRDWLRAMPARGGGSLMGRKPVAFCAWLFDMMGMLPGDELVDLFPGTGVVARAWRELSSYPSRRASIDQRRPAHQLSILAEVDDGSD